MSKNREFEFLMGIKLLIQVIAGFEICGLYHVFKYYGLVFVA